MASVQSAGHRPTHGPPAISGACQRDTHPFEIVEQPAKCLRGLDLAPSSREVPGWVHDGVVTLLEHHPEVLLELWVAAGGPAHAIDLEVEVLPNELRITFGSDEFRHFRPDIVMRLRRRGRHWGIGSLETQGVRGHQRPLGWEIHQLLLQQFFGELPVQFLVALGRAIERWVERQIATRPALRHMCVLGPSKVARIETLEEARARPYHAALAVAVHRDEATRQMCRVAVRVLCELSDDHAGDYLRMVLSAAPREFEKELLMAVHERELEITAVERGGFLYNWAYGRGLRTGKRRGRKEGREEGRDQGLEQAFVTSIATVLEARGLVGTDDLLERLSKCKDHEFLHRAVALASTASSIDELAAALWPKRRPRR